MTRFLYPIFLLLTSASMAAAPVSIYGGAYTAKMSMRGEAGPSTQAFDVRDELGYNRANQWVAWIGIEHRHAPWPKMQLHHSSLSESGTATTPIPLPPLGNMAITVNSRLRIYATDLVFYYTLPNLPFQLDIGGGARRLTVDIDVSTSVTRSPNMPPNVGPQPPAAVHKKTTQHIPVVYGSFYQPLPLGIYASSAIVASRFKHRKLYNSRLAMGWMPALNVGIELGYNHQRHRFEGSDSVDVDLKIGGPYAALALNF